MLAFVNGLETKEQALARAAAHREADNYVQGTFDTGDGKGCSVGCMMQPFRDPDDPDESWHRTEERAWNVPRIIARLQDRIFEGLPLAESRAWTERYIAAVPVGADLGLVAARFMHWLMTDPEGVRRHAREDGHQAIERVAALYERLIGGDTVTDKEWEEADWSAWSAWSAAFMRMADKLVELLAAAPVPGCDETARRAA